MHKYFDYASERLISRPAGITELEVHSFDAFKIPPVPPQVVAQARYVSFLVDVLTSKTFWTLFVDNITNVVT